MIGSRERRDHDPRQGCVLSNEIPSLSDRHKIFTRISAQKNKKKKKYLFFSDLGQRRKDLIRVTKTKVSRKFLVSGLGSFGRVWRSNTPRPVSRSPGPTRVLSPKDRSVFPCIISRSLQCCFMVSYTPNLFFLNNRMSRSSIFKFSFLSRPDEKRKN